MAEQPRVKENDMRSSRPQSSRRPVPAAVVAAITLAAGCGGAPPTTNPTGAATTNAPVGTGPGDICARGSLTVPWHTYTFVSVTCAINAEDTNTEPNKYVNEVELFRYGSRVVVNGDNLERTDDLQGIIFNLDFTNMPPSGVAVSPYNASGPSLISLLVAPNVPSSIQYVDVPPDQPTIIPYHYVDNGFVGAKLYESGGDPKNLPAALLTASYPKGSAPGMPLTVDIAAPADHLHPKFSFHLETYCP